MINVMETKNYKPQIANYFARLKQTLDAIDVETLNQLMNLLEASREQGQQVFIMGNGGSAATASHFVCDFNKGLSENREKRYRFICLNDNLPMLMAYANDHSYEEIFLGPLQNYFRAGDVVIGISGSGNSANVVKAVEWARTHGGVTVALTGYDGGRLKQIAEYGVHIPINDMQITEDLHMVLDHCMMKILYEEIYG